MTFAHYIDPLAVDGNSLPGHLQEEESGVIICSLTRPKRPLVAKYCKDAFTTVTIIVLDQLVLRMILSS